MDRDPGAGCRDAARRPGARRAAADRHPAHARRLGRRSRRRRPPVEAPPPIELTIDGAAVTVPAGTTILGACRAAGHRHADPVLRREPDAGQRLPGLRRRGRPARACSCRPARARSRPGWRSRPTPSGCALSRKVVLEFLGSSVDVSLAGPAVPDGTIRVVHASATARTPTRYGPPAAPAGGRRARRARARPPPRAGGRRDGGDGRPADQDRQRPLRPRLLEVHPLLQVRRGVRRGRPEHVRDRGRRARVRRPDLDRAGRAAARVGVRVLRQLHRRLPDRRADGQARVRHARGGHLGRVGSRP